MVFDNAEDLTLEMDDCNMIHIKRKISMRYNEIATVEIATIHNDDIANFAVDSTAWPYGTLYYSFQLGFRSIMENADGDPRDFDLLIPHGLQLLL